MSRARELAGFATAPDPVQNLSVGIVTATSYAGDGSALSGVGVPGVSTTVHAGFNDVTISGFGTITDVGAASITATKQTTTEHSRVTGIATINTVVVATALTSADSVKSYWGTGGDLQIYHDGSNSYINESGTGDLYIRGGTSVRITDLSDNKMFLGQDGGEAQLYYDGLEKLATKTGGVTITGNAVATSKFRGNDDVKVSLGDGEDLQIYHDGTHSYINEGGTGSLKILSSAVAINKADDSEAVARFYEDGACELYYDDSKKIETTTSGVTVTGELTATSYVGNGSGLSGVGGENDITSCLFT